MIVEGHQLDAPLERRTHTLVIGSGAGGAVVAALLAEAGIEVVALEEGSYVQARDFTQREEEMYPLLYRAGGQQRTADGLVNVLQGCCFGGSTVVNTADCTPIPEEVLAHWHGLFGLHELGAQELEDSRRRVATRLGVNPIPRASINRNNELLLRGAEKLGRSGGTFEHNRTGCIGSGYCLIGCAYDAKRGANLTYLPAAVAAGADVYTDCRAERIERLAADRFRVHGSLLARRSRAARLPVRVEARRVVLAAGAVHSPALLARSGLGRELPQLGRNLSLQPQIGVSARLAGERIDFWRGIPQSAYVDAFDDNTPEHGLGGFRLEAINGGIANAAGFFAGFGHAHKELMASLSERALALLLVPDRPSGELSFADAAVPEVRYRIAPEWEARLRRGMRAAAELYFAAGAREVGFTDERLPPLRSADDLARIDAFRVRPASTHLISAHVQGSCRMARGARAGVVDPDHRVFGQPNLYVVDASVMPTSAATHTMLPVMTLADRAARRMLGRGAHAGS